MQKYIFHENSKTKQKFLKSSKTNDNRNVNKIYFKRL